MKAIQLYLLTVVCLLFSTSSFAQSKAQAGHECYGEATNPEFNCDTNGDREDLRFSVVESQTCEQGKITDTTTLVSGDVFPFNFDLNSYAQASVEFSDTRVHLDDRTNDVTILLPKSGLVQTARASYQIQFSEKIIPLFEGADLESQWGYEAVYKKLNKKGQQVSSGKMICRIVD